MANRDLTSGMLTEIAKDDLEYFLLLEIQFSTVIRQTTAQRDVVFGGNTFNSDGNLLALGAVKEEVGMIVPKMNIVLSGANQANIAAALSEDYNNIKVLLHIGCFDDAGAVITDPLNIFSGFLDTYIMSDDPSSGVSTLTWTAIDDLGRFQKKTGRRNNSKIQQLHFPGDLGFDFSNEPVVNLNWGG